MHTKNPGFYPGGHWVQCEECGFEYRVKDTRKRWDNAVVCKKCFELRHPQDFVRGIKDDPVAKGLIGLVNDNDTATICDAQGVDCRAGNASAGCAICGLTVSF